MPTTYVRLTDDEREDISRGLVANETLTSKTRIKLHQG